MMGTNIPYSIPFDRTINHRKQLGQILSFATSVCFTRLDSSVICFRYLEVFSSKQHSYWQPGCYFPKLEPIGRLRSLAVE